MLLDIKGEKINELPFIGLEKIKVLMSFEYDPVVTHYTDINKDDFISYWVDFDNLINRYLFLKTSKTLLTNYIEDNDVEFLRNILYNPLSEYYLIDYNNDEIVNILCVELINLSKEYLPKP